MIDFYDTYRMLVRQKSSPQVCSIQMFSNVFLFVAEKTQYARYNR